MVPKCLKKGDRVAIVSPATIVNPDYIDGAARMLASEGFEPMVAPHAKGPCSGSYAAEDAGRIADLVDAWRDPSIRAILCARGGYGCNHLIGNLPIDLVRSDPKWLIGFSDVSALHALSLRAGVVSLHAPMAKHLSLLPADHYCTRALLRILSEGLPVKYFAPPHELNTTGEAEGILVGGNLAVINGLAATPFDPLLPPDGKVAPLKQDAALESVSLRNSPRILFIEDVSEAIYAVERMLIRLSLAGTLDSLAGIVVGHFTEYRPDRNHPDMETMIARLVGGRCPTAFGFPAGHTDDNLPLPLGGRARLSVTAEGTTLTISAF